MVFIEKGELGVDDVDVDLNWLFVVKYEIDEGFMVVDDFCFLIDVVCVVCVVWVKECNVWVEGKG